RPFPAHRFVPGLTPRPRPAGHRRPIEAQGTAVGPWSPEDWRTLEPYLHGIDLYNFAYWWEAHEVLEELWHAAGRTSPHARFVQGIIHVSAANLNFHRGHLEAGRRQARRGVLGLSRQSGRIWMGIEVDDFIRQVEGYVTGRASRPALIGLVLDGGGATPTEAGQ
ncbi:MAG: DUF309 domain-containing protein, partial [Gemmatimonadota bacterium]